MRVDSRYSNVALSCSFLRKTTLDLLPIFEAKLECRSETVRMDLRLDAHKARLTKVLKYARDKLRGLILVDDISLKVLHRCLALQLYQVEPLTIFYSTPEK